ncbi:MAG: hypothetical protein K0S48_3685 [Ramlibacter sp.]|nr:hypothetical protein [Ramlibacter sp.]
MSIQWREFWEIASYVVTALGLPVAVLFFAWEQRKERDNEEEEGYQLLSDAYNDFLKVVLAHPDLHLRTQEPLPDPTSEQRERMLVIFDMLTSGAAGTAGTTTCASGAAARISTTPCRCCSAVRTASSRSTFAASPQRSAGPSSSPVEGVKHHG